MEFEILENSADFKPSDLDEIMVSIGWDTEQNAASVPPHETYRVWRTMITWRSPKRRARPWGGWRRFVTAITSLRAIFTA